MRILVDEQWADGYLDQHRSTKELRLEVLRWLVLERIEGLYFVRRRDLLMISNYVRTLGVREVARKVVSRAREGPRNEKFVSCGLGLILEADDPSIVGSHVYFLAPCQPRCAERVVVPERLCAPASNETAGRGLLFKDLSAAPSTDRWWSDFCGWMPASLAPLGTLK